MSARYTNPPGLPRPVDDTYSHVASARGNRIVRIGGQVAVSEAGQNVAIGDMRGQIKVCYEMTDRALKSAGVTWADVTHVYTFTTNIDEYLRHEKPVVADYFGKDPPPSTVLQVSRLVDPEWLLEVQVDALGQ